MAAPSIQSFRTSDRFREDTRPPRPEIPDPHRRLIDYSTARRIGGEMGKMNWVSKKIHLYNVTMGLYMLDWWERCLFNIMVLFLLCFIFLNGARFAMDVYQSHLKARFMHGGNYGMGISMPWT